MDKGRLEAFSDGVIAIIITITVLLIEPPKGESLSDLTEILPLVLVYTVSFIMIGTNWANHHHLLKVTDHINGKIIWANHFYLFTLSFYPVATAWAGKTNFASLPTITYVAVNLVESLAFILVERTILSSHKDSSAHKRLNKGTKELATIILEIAALVFAFIGSLRFISYILLLAMTLLQIVPDIRMEQIVEETNRGNEQMEENTIYRVHIALSSTLDGETTNNNYIGEYRIKNGLHTIVYTDRTGSMITKVGIEAFGESMLIHRVGAFEGDMFFDPESDTSICYGTLSLKHEFRLHTAHYGLTERSDGLLLQVEYTITDRSDEPGIHGFQEMTITKIGETLP